MTVTFVSLVVAVAIFGSRVSVSPGTAEAVTDTVISPQAASRDLSMFGVTTRDDWPSRSLGNHRARLQLDGSGDELAWARVDWRLPGINMEGRQPVLIDERTGKMVNVFVVSSSSDFGVILFEANGSARGKRRRQPARELSREPRSADASYTYDDDRPASWQPRKEAGCKCSGYKNAHGFGAYCKAWEEGLDPNQTPWCYVSAACAADDVQRGSFGERFLNCAPVYADGNGGGGGARRRDRRALRARARLRR